MHHVFISYARRDKDRILPIVEDLRTRGVAVWIDEASIPHAVPWQDEIDAALHSAALVVCFTTENWQASQACQDEYAEADRVGKLVASLDPTDSEPGEIAEWVVSVLPQVPPEYHRTTAVLTRARAWQDSGRKRYLLGAPTLLRRAKSALQATGAWELEHVRAFFTTSRRRNAWRFAGVTLAAITAPATLASLSLAPQLSERLDVVVEEQLRRLSHANTIAQAVRDDPLSALDAIIDEATEDGVVYNVTGYRLLSLTADPWPYLTDGTSMPPPVRTAISPRGDVAEITTEGAVRVRRQDGALKRTIAAASGTVGLAWSPDGRLLAVARPGEIEIVHVTSGRTLLTLPAKVAGPVSSAWERTTAVVWDDTGTLRAAIEGIGIVGWDLITMLPPAIDGEPWVLSGTALGDSIAVALRDGRILLVDEMGAVLAERASTGTTTVLRLWPTDNARQFAAIERRPGTGYRLTILNDALDEVEAFALPDACIPSGSATTPTRYVVTCGNGLFVVVNRASGTVTESITDVSAVAIAAAGERLYARDQTGVLAVLGENLAASTIVPSYPCAVTSSLMAYLPEGDQVLVAGPGTAGTCRSHTYDLATNKPHSMTFPWVRLPRSQALAVSPDGRRAAYGFDDGTVWIVASDGANAYERQVNRSLGAAVRALAFSTDGATLTAVSVDGRVATIAVSDNPLADALARAEAVLTNAREFGWEAKK